MLGMSPKEFWQTTHPEVKRILAGFADYPMWRSDKPEKLTLEDSLAIEEATRKQRNG